MVGADVPGGPRFRRCPRVRGAPGTSRPTMGADRTRGMVGADVPAARVPVGVPVGVPVCAARGNVSLPRICNFCFIGIGLAEARRG